MDHSQVAIQTDTAEKTYANIDILVEQKATELTQPLSMAPVIILKQRKMGNHTPRHDKCDTFYFYEHIYSHWDVWIWLCNGDGVKVLSSSPGLPLSKVAMPEPIWSWDGLRHPPCDPEQDIAVQRDKGHVHRRFIRLDPQSLGHTGTESDVRAWERESIYSNQKQRADKQVAHIRKGNPHPDGNLNSKTEKGTRHHPGTTTE